MPSHVNEPDQGKTDLMKVYFSMLSENEEGFWVESQGLSMLPIFYRGVKVHIEPDSDSFEVGDIVVFHQNDKFIAHRIVGYNHRDALYVTKGDTLYFFDPPISKKRFLGKVDYVLKRGKRFPVTADRRLAEVSNKIGQQLLNSLHWLPSWLKFLYYFLLFIPFFAIYYVTTHKIFKNFWK